MPSKGKDTRASKIVALALRPGTPGERQAATAALVRVNGAVADKERRRLDDRVVAALPPPATGNKIYFDLPDARGRDWVAGFGVRITTAGHRAFILNYRSREGRSGRVTIGSPPQWNVTAARERAKELKREVDAGGDPAKADRDIRDAATVADLLDRFDAEHIVKKRPNTARDYRSVIRLYIRPQLGQAKVATVSYADIARLHQRITTRHEAPFAANRCVALLSKMFSLAIKWKLCTANPAKGIERNHEEERERYLSDDELERLQRALGAHADQQAADILRLLLMTGARRGEVQSAEWRQFDLDAGVWTKPSSHTKQKRIHRVPVSPQALALLKALRKSAPKDARFLFPGRDGGPRRQLKDNWQSILKRAGIVNLRMHDLRHSYASFAVSDGVPLAVVGSLLGHTRAQTTQRYAHLHDAALRTATTRVGAIIGGHRKVPHG